MNLTGVSFMNLSQNANYSFLQQPTSQIKTLTITAFGLDTVCLL